MKFGRTTQRPTTISTSRTSKWHFYLLVLVSGLIPPATFSQSPTEAPHVDAVRFVGATDFSHETLQGQIRTVPNRKLLGLRGMHWWLWLYRLGEAGTLGSRLSNALMNLGEAPAPLDEIMLEADRERLQIFFERHGYRQTAIETQVHLEGHHGFITFNITQGPATIVRRVTYAGLHRLSTAQQQQLLQSSVLPPKVNQPLLNYYAIPQRFTETRLIEERRRILNLLRDMGYAAVTRDSIRALVIPVAEDSFDVEFRVSTGNRFRYGSVQFEVEGPEDSIPLRTDTLFAETGTPNDSSRLVTFRIDGDKRIKSSLLTRTLSVHPGNWYNQSEILTTKRRLEATGVFSFTDIVSLTPTNQILPHRITVRTRPRHQFLLSTFIRQSSGILGGVGNEFGSGLGVTYENTNIFGNGEVLSISTTGSVATDVDTTFFSSSAVEFATTVSLPYLVFPFRRLDSSLNLYQTRTRFTFSYLTARRKDLSLIIRGRASARIRLELQHNQNVTSIIDLMDLSLSQPDTLNGFQLRFLDRVLDAGGIPQIIDPVQRAQILEDYTQPQINNAIRYTLRSENVNLLRRDRGYSYEAAVELGGTLPYFLDRYVFTPNIQEQHLRLFSFADSNTEVIYRQYVRFVGNFRRYYRLGNRTVLAMKFVGGLAHPIGKASVVPFDRRFYSGGASSVRGWRLRQLGPGAASFRQRDNSRTETSLLGGDIKLETSLELRQTVTRDRLGADWILTTFADAGNVWFGWRNPGFTKTTPDSPTGRFVLQNLFRETGVGGGMGLRISWAYLVARLDLAVRVYDPATPEAGFLPTGLNNSVAHFRLGHAF